MPYFYAALRRILSEWIRRRNAGLPPTTTPTAAQIVNDNFQSGSESVNRQTAREPLPLHPGYVPDLSGLVSVESDGLVLEGSYSTIRRGLFQDQIVSLYCLFLQTS